MVAFFALVVSVFPASIWRGGYNRIFLLCVGMVSIFAAYFILVRVQKDLHFLLALVVLLAAAAGVLSITGVLEQFGLVLWQANQRHRQVYTFFANPNLYSGILLLLLPFCAVLALSTSRAIVRVGSIAAFVLGFINLLLAESRASILAFVFSLLFCGFFYARLLAFDKKRAMRILVVAILVILLLVIVIFLALPLFRSKMATILDFRHEARFQAYYIAVGLWQRSPLSIIFGNGLGSFPELYFSAKPPFYRALPYEDGWDAVHNELLERLVDGGVIGLLVFLAFIALFFIASFKEMQKKETDGKRQLITWGAMFAGMAFLLDSMLSTSSRVSFIQFIFFAILGIIEGNSLAVRNASVGSTRRPSGAAMAIIVVLLMCALLPALGKRFLAERHISMAMEPGRSIDSSESLYKSAIAEDPTNVYPTYLLAKHYLDAGQYAESIKTAEKTEKQVENFKDIVLIKGVAAFGLNDLISSRRYIDGYLKRDAYDREGEKFSILVDFLMHDEGAVISRVAETVTGDFVIGGTRKNLPPLFPDGHLIRLDGATFTIGKQAIRRFTEGLMSSRSLNIPGYFFRFNYVLGNIYEATRFPELATSRYAAADAEYRSAMNARMASGAL